jgi:adenine-specific DNA-methyltransferase
LLGRDGNLVFIISDAYNAAKYARKSHEFFIKNARIDRIDFCSDIPLFDAGVKNTILHFAKTRPSEQHAPVRVLRWGDNRDQFETNAKRLTPGAQSEIGVALFRPDESVKTVAYDGVVDLGSFCYVSKGMVIHSNERIAQGSFKAEDVVSDSQDKKHPKPYIEGKDIARWRLRRIRYLEYGTKRAPRSFSRPTFRQLHEPKEKLIAARMCGETPAVTLDRRQLFSNHTAIIFVPWHLLKGIQNKSIKKTSKYKREVKPSQAPPVLREQLEELSRSFAPEYLLAVMNSTFAKGFS